MGISNIILGAFGSKNNKSSLMAKQIQIYPKRQESAKK